MLTYAGGVEKERDFVVSGDIGFVSECKKGGWNLQVAVYLLY
jgi:hypothetical protein